MNTINNDQNNHLKVVIIIPSDTVARSLVDSGALDMLIEKTKVYFFMSKEVTISLPGESQVVDLPSLSSPFAKRLDRLFWYHSLYEYMRKHNLRDEDSFKVQNLKWIMRRVHEFLAFPVFSRIVRKLDEWYFSKDLNSLVTLSQIKPNLIVAPGLALDTYSHMILRTAQKLGIPTLMIIAHWDYFTKKGLLRVKPDKVYVWGSDMKNTAIALNEVAESAVSVLGAPQFQKYLTELPGEKSAQTELGLSTDISWLFFPGAGLPYDEISIVKQLSDYLIRMNHNDIGILYRPHPKASLRKTKQENGLINLKNVVIDKPQQSQTDSHYKNLIAASKGVISPYSTMVLEGGLCGLPALCLGFADKINSWDFSQANDLEHIRPLLQRGWIIPCLKSEDLEKNFEKFLEKISEPGLASAVVSQVVNTVYFDDRKYSERLWENIKRDFLI